MDQAVLLMIAALLLGLNAITGPFIFDDISRIVNNAEIRAPGFPKIHISHEGLPRFLHALIYRVVGPDPTWFHVLGLLVHGVAAVGVLLLLRVLQARAKGVRHDRVYPMLGAFFFLLSPLQMGSAIYASALPELLAGALSLFAAWFWLRGASPSRKDAASAVVCAAFALLSHPSACVLPVLLLLCDWILPRESSFKTRRWWMGWGALAMLCAGHGFFFGAIAGGTKGAELLRSQALVWWKYLALTLVPAGLSKDHWMPLANLPSIGFGVFLGSLWIAVWATSFAWFKLRASATSRLCFLGLNWFLVGLVGASMNASDLPMDERRVYLPFFGVALMMTLAYETLARILPTSIRKNAPQIAGFQLIALALLSMARNLDFSSEVQAWRRVLAVYPSNERALGSLAKWQLEHGDVEGAVESYDLFIALNPNDVDTIRRLAELLSRDGPAKDYPKSIIYYRKLIELDPDKPDSHFQVARMLQQLGRGDDAVKEYEAAVRLKPNDLEGLNNLAALLLRRQDYAGAREHLEQIFRLSPGYPAAMSNMRYLESHDQAHAKKRAIKLRN